MLSKAGCQGRLRRFVERLDGEIDLAIITDPKHIHYLANFFPSPIGLSYPSLNFLIVRPSMETVLLVDNWLGGVAQASLADRVEINPWYDFTTVPVERNLAAGRFLLQFLAREGGEPRVIGVELAQLPADLVRRLGTSFPSAELQGVSHHLAEMRRKKDEDEIGCIREALAVCTAVHSAARECARDGISELELYAEIYAAAVAEAREPIPLIMDLMSGERSGEFIGAPPSGRVMKKGELLLVDTYPIVRGYRGDVTNTLVIGGEATDVQRERFAAVQAAVEAGERAVRPGAVCREIYLAMRQVLDDAGIGEHFLHHGGHGLGLGHPEPPHFVPQSDEVIEEGMVITLEPGFNQKGYGGMRIEHNYVVTGDGVKKLSTHEIGL